MVVSQLVPIDERAATVAGPSTGSGERQLLGGRYELLGLLGSGGMGNVYRARDVELDEVVALKVLLPHLVSAPGALERFRREVKLARRVTHPNVARVFDIGEHGGDRVLTMELVDGESLASYLHREGRPPIGRAVEIARAICAGVGAAHAAGVVHRDLKPDNVLLEKGGRVVVTDFGIARAAAEASRTVGVVGTPAYMAPEQIDERASIDHRADVYALGAVLYEMLVGEPAWRGESLWALAAARLLEPPPDPRAKRPDLPPALAEIVVRAMARDPAGRPPSMLDVDRALGAVELPRPSVVPTPVPAPRAEAGVPTTGTDKRVAVLPFANGGPPADDYVADGLTEDLIDALSVARGLRVRSRGAVMPYKGATRDAREVGRELDVQVVVEGSVRRAPGGFRITARLVSVLDGFQLWAKRFDVPEAQLLVENDRIAAAVAEALSTDLATPRREAPANVAAVDLYLRARHAYQRSFSGDRAEPMRLFEELVALTPDDPRALAGLAMAGAHQWFWPPGTRARLLGMADRATALAPSLPDGLAARGCLHLFAGEAVESVAPLRKALQIAPTCVEALEALGRVLAMADCEDALPYLEAAHALEPKWEFPYIHLTGWHTTHGAPDRAEELLERARVSSPGLYHRLATRFVAWRLDRPRAAALLAELEAGPMDEGTMFATVWLRAVARGERVPSGPPPGPPGLEMPLFMRWFFLEMDVEISAAVGDLSSALAGLAQLAAAGSPDLVWLARADVLAPLRALPEAAPHHAAIAARAAAVVAAYRAPLS